jgi:hypothetical protein
MMAYSTDTQIKIDKIRTKTGPKAKPLAEKFWAKVDRRGEDECWPWLGATRNGTSYGSIGHQGKNLIAYRVSFELHCRLLEQGEWVLRTCDDQTCVNPKHLYVGDRLDWAKKTHGIDPDDDHVRALGERARRRSRQYYRDNREQKLEYIARYQLERKLKAVKHLGGKCMHCGFSDHPAALQFHHRDPAEKSMGLTGKELSSPKKYDWETVIVPELKKCDLLCSNCHAIHHSNWTDEMIVELR